VGVNVGVEVVVGDIVIDGVGVTDVVKYDYDLSGFTTLDIGEIQPSVNYFLVYDGTQFQFFTSSL